MHFSLRKYFGKQILAIFLVTQVIAQTCSAETGKNASAIQNSRSIECKITPVKKSKAAIEAILSDLDSTYSGIGGGGISEIKQTRTNVYVVSIPQEERIDQFTYKISVDEACKAKILNKEPSTKSFQK